MKIFAIRDESAACQIDLAYLLYYERQKTFYIEMPKERTRVGGSAARLFFRKAGRVYDKCVLEQTRKDDRWR